MHKKVLILYTSHDAGQDKPFSDLKYQHCYEALYTLGETMGLHLCRAPLDWYDPTLDLFRTSWEFVGGHWRLSGPVKPDLVFDKTRGRSVDDQTRALIISRYRFVDDPLFTRFANDKYETSRQLPEHFKPYRKIVSHGEYVDFLRTFSGDQLVIKPVVGSGGQGVHIVSKAEAGKLSLTFPVIVQEFIDSSHGIPGITDTYHDLRLVFIGDELVYSYVRTPKEGSLLANIAQGGSMTIIPNEKLPPILQPIIDDTKRLFSKFPQKTYTIDVMFDETSRPWIIEYNTMPGMFFPPEEENVMLRVYDRLLRELKSFLEQPDQDAHTLSALILFTPYAQDETVAFQKEVLRDAYTAFAKQAEAEGLKLYRASTKWYDEPTHSFRMAWHWDGKTWLITEAVTPDVIYDKSATTPETIAFKNSLLKRFPMVNHPEFSAQTGSKLLVSLAFKKFTKPYHHVLSQEKLAAALKQLPEGLVVAKPERGNSGEGVVIVEKEKLDERTLSYPLLIQEFIDSSAGIPGVMEGFHDLRLIFSNEEFLYAYYRTPKEGSFLANIAQGGRMAIVDKDSLPAAVWPIVEAVQRYYAPFNPKIYTIDLMFDHSGRPWIIELNTMPGLYPDESERPFINRLYLAVIRALKDAMRIR